MNPFIDGALRLAAAGYRVLPLAAGKKLPLTTHGVKDASSDSRVIRGWWGRSPTANIGVATGRGLMVLDVDEGGETTLAGLEDKNGPLPATRQARTGRGGRHIHLATPPGVIVPNSVRTLGPGLDVRADEGYIVVPPSVTAGPYTWMVGSEPGGPTPLAPSPDWLLKIVVKPETGANASVPATEWSSLVAQGVDEGSRNATVTRLAGLLFRRLPAEAALDLLQLWNASRCRPPLGDAELDKIVASIANKELKRRRSARGE